VTSLAFRSVRAELPSACLCRHLRCGVGDDCLRRIHWEGKPDAGTIWTHSLFTQQRLHAHLFAAGRMHRAASSAGRDAILPAMQVLWLSFVMIPLYALNQQLVYATFKALDVGGSISIHAFGAYYGLAASLVLSRCADICSCSCHHGHHKRTDLGGILKLLVSIRTLSLRYLATLHRRWTYVGVSMP